MTAAGKKVLRPDLRRKGIYPTFPIGRYVSQPLTVKCDSINDICNYLGTCRWVSDKQQFDRDDYWQPPEQFEQRKKGDCDDYALWTWREFLAFRFDARFVVGRASRYRTGYAWVHFFQDGKCFLVDPGMWPLGVRFPRLSTLRYHPEFSVAWDGTNVSFYSRAKREGEPTLSELIPLVPDWILSCSWLWIRMPARLPFALTGRVGSRFFSQT
jgi:hypothetical protein